MIKWFHTAHFLPGADVKDVLIRMINNDTQNIDYEISWYFNDEWLNKNQPDTSFCSENYVTHWAFIEEPLGL